MILVRREKYQQSNNCKNPSMGYRRDMNNYNKDKHEKDESLDDFYTAKNDDNNQLNSNNKNNSNNNYSNNPDNYPNPYMFVKKDKMPTWVIIVLSLVVSIVLVIGSSFAGYFIGKSNRYTSEDMGLSNQIYDLLDEFYYKDISREEFDKAAALGVSNMLDNFSRLVITGLAEEPKFGFSMSSDSRNYHYINSVEKNSSAGTTVGKLANEKGEVIENAIPPEGLYMRMARGDLLYMINGHNVVGLDRNVLSNSDLLGKETGTFVVKRDINGAIYYISIDIERSIFTGSDAKYTSMGNDIGMITLNSFAGYDAEDFELAAAEFCSDTSANKLILDLRDNGGGDINNLATIATYLIDSDVHGKKVPINRIIKKDGAELIFTTDNITNSKYFVGRDKANYELVVLINGGSASASEGLVGALRAYMPDTIFVGEETYGKGVAQGGYDIPGYNLRLHMTIGYFDVPIFQGGALVWANYHEDPMQPTKGYMIKSIDPLGGLDQMPNYYNSDITNELAYKKAMLAFESLA